MKKTATDLTKRSVKLLRQMKDEGMTPSDALVVLINAAFGVFLASDLAMNFDDFNPKDFDEFVSNMGSIYDACIYKRVGDN